MLIFWSRSLLFSAHPLFDSTPSLTPVLIGWLPKQLKTLHIVIKKYLGLWWMIDIAAILDSQARSYWCTIIPCKWKWTVDRLYAGNLWGDFRPRLVVPFWTWDPTCGDWTLVQKHPCYPLWVLAIGRRNKIKNHFLRFLSFILIRTPRLCGLFFFNRIK